MPDSSGPVFRPDYPITIVVGLSILKQPTDVLLHRFFTRTVSAFRPVGNRRDVLDGITGKLGPALADLQNPVVLIMNDDRKGKVADRLVEEAADPVL